MIALTIGDFRLEQIFLTNGGRYFINKPMQSDDVRTTIRRAYRDFEPIREELKRRTSTK